MPTALATGTSSRFQRLIQPGLNCWQCCRAQRAAVLIDGAAFFGRLAEALRAARRSITIVGWDFDGRIKLEGGCTADGPTLGELLRSLVEERKALEVRILVWNLAVLGGPSGAAQLLLGAEWQQHPRITLKLDAAHPLYGSQHQKIVVIDDRLAFAGGMDLTVDRWDTPEHLADDPRRRTPDGKPYPPVHDVQLVVDGEPARALGELVRARWAEATGETIEGTAGDSDPWPEGLTPDFERVDVAIARSLPKSGAREEVAEAAALTDAALASAQRYVFLEAQYMAAPSVAKRLEELLARVSGPEIVIVAPRSSRTLGERIVMGFNRDRMIRRLKRADRYDRMRIYYPVVPSGRREKAVMVHSKVVVVDDVFLRVGSSNINNRSVALDSECDLALVADDEATATAIRGVLCRLLSEHVGAAPERLDEEIDRRGGLIAAVEVLNGRRRGLRRFAGIGLNGPISPLPLTGLLDPERVLRPFHFLRRNRLS